LISLKRNENKRERKIKICRNEKLKPAPPSICHHSSLAALAIVAVHLIPCRTAQLGFQMTSSLLTHPSCHEAQFHRRAAPVRRSPISPSPSLTTVLRENKDKMRKERREHVKKKWEGNKEEKMEEMATGLPRKRRKKKQKKKMKKG
jgi:hypothetical protein